MDTWSIEDLRADGVTLKGFGWGVSLVGGLSGTPPVVGENIEVAYRRGRKWRQKQYTQVTRQFTMWVDSRDPATGLYPGTYLGRVTQRNSNLRTVYQLLGKRNALIKFDRDIQTPTGLVTVSGYGECASEALNVNFGDNSDEETNFNVDLVFPDPFWYGAQITSPNVTAGGTTVTNPGDDVALDSVVTINASSTLVNPSVRNTTNGSRFTVTTTVAAGDALIIECEYPRVRRVSNNQNLIGAVSHEGARQFLTLNKGPNVLQLASTSGTGGATIQFYPPYY